MRSMIDAEATLIVTRPEPDAQTLVDALRERGRRVIAFPVIAIEPVIDAAALTQTMARVDDYRLVVFVSPNAIRQAMAHRNGPWPDDVTIGVMGPGSVATLETFGIAEPAQRVVSPAVDRGDAVGERFDSESLFEALDAKLGLSNGFEGRALILRGNGGRAWFADRLRALGIAVDEVEAYRRMRPEPDRATSDALGELIDATSPAAFIVTSSEGIVNLVMSIEQALALRGVSTARARSWLFDATLVAPHRRIAEKARQAGFSRVLLCAPGNDGILAAIE